MIDRYRDQVQLLVETLPYVANQKMFALKGGTAINLFYRDLPRLSVDIDLFYLPVEDRETSLRRIDDAMDQITADINAAGRHYRAERIQGGDGNDTRVRVIAGDAQIKIETSQGTRGTVLKPQKMQVSEAVQKEFGFADLQVVAFEDLYGGKLHAALDRQHPRDLFDVKLLYENEGLTEELFRIFMVYVASSNRPMHELLSPNLVPLDQRFTDEFEGMTREPVSQAELEEVRHRLHGDIKDRLNGDIAHFLLSLHDAEPDFDLIGLPQAAALPAIRWKLLNLETLKRDNPGKHAEQRQALEDTFE
nr:nucleotidyl transferase AbiEii/AbiGii toxin family protein [Euryhalocaulis caribicus]